MSKNVFSSFAVDSRGKKALQRKKRQQILWHTSASKERLAFFLLLFFFEFRGACGHEKSFSSFWKEKQNVKKQTHKRIIYCASDSQINPMHHISACCPSFFLYLSEQPTQNSAATERASLRIWTTGFSSLSFYLSLLTYFACGALLILSG